MIARITRIPNSNNRSVAPIRTLAHSIAVHGAATTDFVVILARDNSDPGRQPTRASRRGYPSGDFTRSESEIDELADSKYCARPSPQPPGAGTGPDHLGPTSG
ncbi:hypothetical protein GCM10022294_25610 [Dietzia aurantiaca]